MRISTSVATHRGQGIVAVLPIGEVTRCAAELRFSLWCSPWRRWAAQAADLVVWWEKGFNPEEDAAVKEILAAFEHASGKRWSRCSRAAKLPDAIETALEAGRPPDFAFGIAISGYISEWAFDDRLVDLTGTVGSFSDLFDPDALAWWNLANHMTGQKGAVRPADRAHDQPHPHLDEPPRTGGIHPRRHPEGVGSLLVVLV